MSSIDMDIDYIHQLIKLREKPKRKLFSEITPYWGKYTFKIRSLAREKFDGYRFKLSETKTERYFEYKYFSHQSPLKKFGARSLYQRGKIKNIKVVCNLINKVVIAPGETFSFWHIVGQPTRARGFEKGMLLKNGQVSSGIGGGICQVSNLLFWMFLHTPMEIVERHHHSYDVFPDSGRSLPFGSGATVLYNLLDLKVKNTTKTSFQIKLEMNDKYLKGMLYSNLPKKHNFHIKNDIELFVRNQKNIYRYAKLNRYHYTKNNSKRSNPIATILAPVLYPLPPNNKVLEI